MEQLNFSIPRESIMQIAVIDRVLTLQSLITGVVRDALTERLPLYPPIVTLRYQTAPGEPERRYPLTARLYRNGRFVFPGDPTNAFPRLSAGRTLDLLLRVSAPRYQTQEIHFSLSDVDLMTTTETREIDGRSITLELLGAHLFEKTVDLLPEPLHLNGRIVEADEADAPIANASVNISGPRNMGPYTTDTDGYFTIYDLPVASQVRINAQHAGFVSLDTWISLNYHQPVNQMTFTLKQT
jgi:hypothetical protein